MRSTAVFAAALALAALATPALAFCTLCNSAVRLDSALATSIGLSEESLSKLMADVGLGRKDGAWTWRGRRDQRRETHKPTSNAFAELAKLRRK